MEKSKRVLMIIPELWTGGAQRSFMQLANDLSKYHHVEIVVFNNASPSSHKTILTIYSLDLAAGKNALDKAIQFFKRVYRLKKIKQKVKPSVSISFLEGADYVNILSSNGERVIISIRGTKEFDLQIAGALGWLRKQILIPFIYKRAWRIITVSKFLEDEMKNSFGIRPEMVRTIYNYYDFELLNQRINEPLPEIFQNWLTGRLLVNVGRLHPQKNQLFLIDVFADILNNEPTAKLIIVGNGPLLNSLTAHAEEKMLRTYVYNRDDFNDSYQLYFLGEVNNPFPIIRRCELFIFPSLYEGFPNALVEAMYAEIPVVSANCNYGPSEIINFEEVKSGVLLPIYLPNQNELKKIWVDVIGNLLDDEQTKLHFVTNAQIRMKDFARDKILNNWLELIEV